MKALLVTDSSEILSVDDLKRQLRIDNESILDGPDEVVMIYAEEELMSFAKAARSRVQAVTRRAILTQRWIYFLNEFPGSNKIFLPFGNLQSILSLTIVDSVCVEADGEHALIFTGACSTTATGTYTIVSNIITAVTLTNGGLGYITAPIVRTQALDGSITAQLASVKYKDSNGVETILTVGTDFLIETNGNQCGSIALPYGESWPSETLYSSNPIAIEFLCGWPDVESVPKEIKVAALMIAADLYQNRSSKNEGQAYGVNWAVGDLLATWRLWDEFDAYR